VSSAGWRKPVGEQYPSEGLLARLAARAVPLTTASDAHQLSQVADRAGDLRTVLASVGVERLQGYRRRQAHTVPVSPAPADTAGAAPQSSNGSTGARGR